MRNAKPKELDETGLWAYAVNALGRRALSTGEIRQRLSQRSKDTEAINRVIARLKDSHFLDDARFAEGFANSRRERQGLGSRRVVQDLRQRRVSPQLAGKAVEAAYEGVDEVEMVKQFLERKYRNTDLATHLSEPKNLAAAYRKLRYAGFGPGVAITVLRGYSEQASELEDTPED